MAERQERVPDDGKYLAAAILVGLALYVVWTYWKAPIVYTSFAIDWVQIRAVSFVLGLNERGRDLLDFMEGVFAGNWDVQSVTWAELRTVSTEVGGATRLLLSPILLCIAVYALFRVRGDGFRRTISLTRRKGGFSLADYQAQLFPVSLPSVRFDPAAKDAPAPAMRPIEWMQENNVTYNAGTSGLDTEAARAAFAAQLQKRWHGVSSADLHVQALCVAFAIAHRGDKDAYALRGKLADFYTRDPEKADERVRKLLAKYLEDPKLVRWIDKGTEKNAYATTAVFGLMLKARERSGILPACEFLWLKSKDRTLWYCVNCVGRRSFFVECAGAVSHFWAETVGQAALVEPWVKQALEGLEMYLKRQGIGNAEDYFEKEATDE